MPLEVGQVTTRLGYTVDDRGADQYERRNRALRSDSRRDIVQKAKVDGDVKGAQAYKRAVDDVDHSHGNLVRGSGRLRGALGGLIIGGAGVAGAGLAFGALAKGVASTYNAFEESNKIARQTDAVLKSTGGAAKVTAKDVSDLATAISKKTGIDDEAIQSGENMLLTFTNVRNEAGKGNDIFNRSTQVLTDMSAALGQDMSSSAIQLGKALNDPIKGVTALQRVGVTFDAKTKDHIKTLVEHGHRLEAQKIILRELNKEFGGSAAAQATWGDRLKVTMGNLEESIGKALAPAIESASKWLDGFVNGMMDGTGVGGRFVAMLKGAGGVIKDVVGVGAGLVGLFKSSGTSSSDAAKGIRSGFGSIASTVKAVWTTLKKTVGDIVGAFSGASEDFKIIGTRLAQAWGLAWGLISSIIKRELPGIRAALSGLATIVRGVVDVIAGILTLDFGRIWEGVKRIFGGAVRALGGIVRGMTAPFREVAARIGGLLGSLARDAARWVGRMVTGMIDKAGDLVSGLWNAVKGAVVKLAQLDIALHEAAVKAGVRLVRGLIDKAGDLAGKLWGAIKGAAGKVVDLGEQLGTRAANAGKTLVSRLVSRVRALPGDLWGALKGGISKLHDFEAQAGSAMLGAGKSIVQALVNGIKSAPGAVINAISDLVPGPLKKVAKHIPGVGALFKRRGGKAGPGEGGPAVVFGEGDKTEWWISQEGNRGQNIRWGVEALEALTGRGVAFYRAGGKKAKKAHKKKPLKPILSKGKTSSGVTTQERGLANFERDIARLERQYGQLDRGNSLSVEELVVEHPDGSTTVDEKAVGKRSGEIEAQIGFLRDKVGEKIRAYRAAVTTALKVYNTVIDRLTRAIARAKGARRASERQGYVDKRNQYVARRAELSDKFTDLGLDLEDNRLDIEELRGEEADVKGTKPAAASAPDAPDTGTPADTGGGDAGVAPAGDTTAPAAPEAAPPSAEEIARGVAAELAAFNQGRQDLFASFGGNFMRAGGRVDPLGLAAGLSYFGATGAVGSEGASTTVNITNNYGSGPGDPHTWAQQQRRQVEVALG